jgi:hypothetical protein
MKYNIRIHTRKAVDIWFGLGSFEEKTNKQAT